MVQLTGWCEMMRAGVVVVRRAESGEQLQYRDQVSTRISAVRHSSSQHLEDHHNMASFRMVSLNVEYTPNIQDINYARIYVSGGTGGRRGGPDTSHRVVAGGGRVGGRRG